MDPEELDKEIKKTSAFDEYMLIENNRTLPEDLAEKIYIVLEKECGAPKGQRDDFVWHFSEDKDPTREWRFCGELGFGGKFRWNERFFVNYYPEDKSKLRDEMVEKANAKLTELFIGYLKELKK